MFLKHEVMISNHEVMIGKQWHILGLQEPAAAEYKAINLCL